MTLTKFASHLFAAFVVMITGHVSFAQDVRIENLSFEGAGDLLIVEDAITGYGMVDYVIGADGAQIISVDLQTSNPSAYFNVLPAGSNEALFTGSVQGNVADIPAPATGDYLIRIYLMRAAARREEIAEYSLAVSIGAPEFADGLFGGPDYLEVSGVGDGDALNLRSGPGTRYAVKGKLRDGEVLGNLGCRLSGDVRWCQIRAVGSGVNGWTAGQYLVETAPPQAPVTPEGGPVGNGNPFDATGEVACATDGIQPARTCLFGVIREGHGNAGVWIVLGNGTERQILFESGAPVTSDAPGVMTFEMQSDLFMIRIGEERFEIPEAVVNGG